MASAVASTVHPNITLRTRLSTGMDRVCLPVATCDAGCELIHAVLADSKPQQPVYQPPQEQQTQIQHEEKDKHWWDLDEDRKKELLVSDNLSCPLNAI